MADDGLRKSQAALWKDYLQAIARGNMQAFLSLLQTCPPEESWARILLETALRYDRREMLELLVLKLQTGVISLKGSPERLLERVLVKAITWKSNFLVKELVKLGVDLNAANFDFHLYDSPGVEKKNLAGEHHLRGIKRRTLLACVLSYRAPEGNKKEIVEFLLDQDADPAYLESDGGFSNEYGVDEEIMQLLRQRYPLSLQHLAAFTIVKNRVQYQGLVPEKVAAYIQGHE